MQAKLGTAPSFVIHILGNLSKSEANIISNRLTPLEKQLNVTTTLEFLNYQENDIAHAYHQTLASQMLIICGMPYKIPSFGSLSRSLFGQYKNADSSFEYIKKINILVRNDEEKEAWKSYLVFLHKLILWSSTQVDDFLPPKEFLKNIFIVSSVADISIPNEEEAKKAFNLTQPVDNIVYDFNHAQKLFDQDFNNINTQVFYNDSPVCSDRTVATVISCATPLLPYNQVATSILQYAGKALAELNVIHVYGAAISPGIMQLLAEASWSAGGEVSGVISAREYNAYVRRDLFAEANWGIPNLKELHITSQLATRTKYLLSSADFLIIAPGGTGTIEELAYFQTTKEHWDKPIFILNVEGHLNHLEEFVIALQKQQLLSQPVFIIKTITDIDNIFKPEILCISRNKAKRVSKDNYLTTNYSKAEASSLTLFQPMVALKENPVNKESHLTNSFTSSS